MRPPLRARARAGSLSWAVTISALALVLLRATVATTAPSSQAQPAATGTAAISGVVVEAGTSKPIANAIVQVAGTTARTSMVTDPSGRFVARDLPAGTYGIGVMALGYFSSTFGNEDLPNDFIITSGEPRIVLAEGEWLRDVRIGMRRPASVTGAVRDERGEPIVNRFVRLLRVDARDSRPPYSIEGAAVTDDRGIYTIGRVPPGDYVAVVLPFDKDALEGQTEGAVGYVATFHPNSRTLRDATTVRLESGANRTGIDFVVESLPSHRVSGHVDGPPAAWANLRLALVSTAEPALGTTSWLNTAWVEADGSFNFPNVPAGSYTIISASWRHFDSMPPNGYALLGLGMRPWELPGDGGPSGAFSPYTVSFALDVGDRDLRDLQIPIHPSGSVSGRVRLSSPSVRLQQTMERAAAVGITGLIGLSLVSESGAGGPGSGGPDGTFAIADVFGGRSFLRGFLTYGIKSIIVDGRDVSAEPFDFRNGASYTGVQVLVADLSQLSGTVSLQSRPATRAGVLAFPVERAEWDQFRSHSPRFFFAAATTDGNYTMPIPGGHYYVVALPDSARNKWRNLEFLEAASKVATMVDVEWGATKTLDLQQRDVEVK